MIQVGTLVRIKNEYDKGHGEFSYRYHFTNMMLQIYGGKVLEIRRAKEERRSSAFAIEDDNCTYELMDPVSREPIAWNWSSGMFSTVYCEVKLVATIF